VNVGELQDDLEHDRRANVDRGVVFSEIGYPVAMPDAEEKRSPADPADLADAIAFALRYSGRRRVHKADDYIAKIAAERIVRHLEAARFVVMRRSAVALRCGARLFQRTMSPESTPLLPFPICPVPAESTRKRA
jgi:hypothetical protein